MLTFRQRVYQIVTKIPQGRVMTYSQIAAILGNPKAARAVGNALHKNLRPDLIPCHRVVNKQGQLAKNFGGGGMEVHKERLKKEGVKFNKNHCLDLGKYLFINSS